MIRFIAGDPYLAGEARREMRREAGVPLADVAMVPAAQALDDDLAGVAALLGQGTMFGPPPWVETPDLYGLLNGLAKKGGEAARTRLATLLRGTEGTWIVSAERAAGPGRKAFRSAADVKGMAEDPAAFLGEDAPAPDLQERRLPTDGRGRPDPGAFVAGRLEREGLSPDRAVAKAVVERVGPEPAALAMAAATLALLKWPEKRARPADAASLPRGGAVTVWALLDHVLDGRAGDAHSLLDSLQRAGEDPVRVLGWLVAEWRRLALALDPADGSRLKAALGPRQAWKEKRLRARAGRVGRAGLGSGFSSLAAADLTLKAGGDDPWAALTLLLYNLADGR